MSEAAFLLRGLVLGFSIAAPVGPIGVLCIRRTLADGRATGLATGVATGMGAAAAAGLYGLVAGLAITSVTFDTRALGWVNRLSGAVIVAFGAAALVSAIPMEA